LTIAGSDSSGGAGIQADLKTFAAHRVYGASVLTAVTAQNTVGVKDALVLDESLVGSQLEAVLSDIGADAIKVGMLGNEAIVRTVATALTDYRSLPLVLDPVMIAKSGDSLLEDAAVRVLSSTLLPLATLVTPNLPEAARLTGLPVESPSERIRAARQIAEAGPAVLLKGGHGGGDQIEDLLWSQGEARWFRGGRIDTGNTHGTGCTLSSAVTARLARGESLQIAVEGAIRYVREAIRSAPDLGAGHGPVEHLYRFRNLD
jgi:hydroxymethylpyrimidine/phosphomethylpyrimidine kinase